MWGHESPQAQVASQLEPGRGKRGRDRTNEECFLFADGALPGDDDVAHPATSLDSLMSRLPATSGWSQFERGPSGFNADQSFESFRLCSGGSRCDCIEGLHLISLQRSLGWMVPPSAQESRALQLSRYYAPLNHHHPRRHCTQVGRRRPRSAEGSSSDGSGEGGESSAAVPLAMARSVVRESSVCRIGPRSTNICPAAYLYFAFGLFGAVSPRRPDSWEVGSVIVTATDWIAAMHRYRVSSPADLAEAVRRSLPPATSREYCTFHRFVFDLLLAHHRGGEGVEAHPFPLNLRPHCRMLPTSVACHALRTTTATQLSVTLPFTAFVEYESHTTGISADVWNSFLEFARHSEHQRTQDGTVDGACASATSPASPELSFWPSLIDSFLDQFDTLKEG